jgi:hypothetical protein
LGPDLVPFPPDLWDLLDNIYNETGFILPELHIMDYTGKGADVVDFGGEVNYDGYQWFQDVPPKAQVHIFSLARIYGYLADCT